MPKKETAEDMLRLLRKVNELVTLNGAPAKPPGMGTVEDYLNEQLDRIKLIASDAIAWATELGLDVETPA